MEFFPCSYRQKSNTSKQSTEWSSETSREVSQVEAHLHKRASPIQQSTCGGLKIPEMHSGWRRVRVSKVARTVNGGCKVSAMAIAAGLAAEGPLVGTDEDEPCCAGCETGTPSSSQARSSRWGCSVRTGSELIDDSVGSVGEYPKLANTASSDMETQPAHASRPGIPTKRVPNVSRTRVWRVVRFKSENSIKFRQNHRDARDACRLETCLAERNVEDTPCRLASKSAIALIMAGIDFNSQARFPIF
jgi:hypothetical protein